MEGMSSPPPPLDDEDRRSAALTGFLGAGLDPAPTTAALVSALAEARRAVAAVRSRGESIDEWLAMETRFRGIRENAATLAVLEASDVRDSITNSYRQRYPERVAQLEEIVSWL